MAAGKGITTFGSREPREDIGGEIQRFLVRVATAPLVLNGHLKSVPPRKYRRNGRLEAGDRSGLVVGGG